MKANVERLGVSRLEFYFSQNGWLFREQVILDFGIDAQVEIVDENYPTGDLIAIQIKSGLSFFDEETDDSYVFRTTDKHISYWANHSLPVILVLYHPEQDKLYWQSISEETVINTGKNWKVKVPKSNELTEKSFYHLSRLTQPEPYVKRMNKLKLDVPWMQKLSDGEDVFLHFADWVNKSLPRYKMTISSASGSVTFPMTYMPGMTLEKALEYFIPWADFEMDIDAHKMESESQWSAECYMGKDSETGEYYFGESFEEWYVEPDTDEIIPTHFDGECEYYSLKLSLNELGESFLALYEFLATTSEIEKRVFTENDLQW
ncbi:TPA: DUF4365 domain-containing protein [Vibrio parahaemolyticus]|uniref:DUF4365 domain-containing protein n=1 Tax=Vibrio parahaemolyticus TaxID=670 RepID=UPI00111D7F5C|nr:DUF4365 domain-containing protein [Vibrio parahaemolyticus]TOG28153.1 hypothetical protein CGJ04_23620 [Vibrio parahaemolyticus]